MTDDETSTKIDSEDVTFLVTCLLIDRKETTNA